MKRKFDEVDKAVIRLLQEEIPLTEEPYRELAEKIGISEKEFLARAQQLFSEGSIRKMGAVLCHRNAGFSSNVLCAWSVPFERLDDVAIVMCKHPAVSHCYSRNAYPDWQYNLYTMIHGRSKEDCEAVVCELEELAGIREKVLLYTKKEWKKRSMKYFT